MLNLSLSTSEARELDVVLRRQLKQLLNELAHTDDREFRRYLRQTYDDLERLGQRLGTLLEAAA